MPDEAAWEEAGVDARTAIELEQAVLPLFHATGSSDVGLATLPDFVQQLSSGARCQDARNANISHAVTFNAITFSDDASRNGRAQGEKVENPVARIVVGSG